MNVHWGCFIDPPVSACSLNHGRAKVFIFSLSFFFLFPSFSFFLLAKHSTRERRSRDSFTGWCKIILTKAVRNPLRHDDKNGQSRSTTSSSVSHTSTSREREGIITKEPNWTFSNEFNQKHLFVSQILWIMGKCRTNDFNVDIPYNFTNVNVNFNFEMW